MKEILLSHPVKNLRMAVKNSNIRGYSKMTKPQLINEMMKPQHRNDFKDIKKYVKPPPKKREKKDKIFEDPKPKPVPAPRKKNKQSNLEKPTPKPRPAFSLSKKLEVPDKLLPKEIQDIKKNPFVKGVRVVVSDTRRRGGGGPFKRYKITLKPAEEKEFQDEVINNTNDFERYRGKKEIDSMDFEKVIKSIKKSRQDNIDMKKQIEKLKAEAKKKPVKKEEEPKKDFVKEVRKFQGELQKIREKVYTDKYNLKQLRRRIKSKDDVLKINKEISDIQIEANKKQQGFKKFDKGLRDKNFSPLLNNIVEDKQTYERRLKVIVNNMKKIFMSLKDEPKKEVKKKEEQVSKLVKKVVDNIKTKNSSHKNIIVNMEKFNKKYNIKELNKKSLNSLEEYSLKFADDLEGLTQSLKKVNQQEFYDDNKKVVDEYQVIRKSFVNNLNKLVIKLMKPRKRY